MSEINQETLDKVAKILEELGVEKEAFIPAPGGNMPQDPMAGGMPPPPGDPMAGGMPPPPMEGGMPPGDPMAGGMPPGDPMAGGMPPPPMGGDPMAGGQDDEMAILYSMIEDAVRNILAEQGITPGGEAAGPEAPAEKKVTNDTIMEKLDEISTRVESLEASGAPAPDQMGDIGAMEPIGVGPIAPGANEPLADIAGSKMAEQVTKSASIIDRIKELQRYSQ